MDPRFLGAFVDQVNGLIKNPPFDWIFSMINDVTPQVVRPPIQIRPDGMLFLLGNIGGLIVMPWETTEHENFRTTHGRLLTSDIMDILRNGITIATQRGVNELSANILLDATANRNNALATRGLQIWGP
jgi:hypothetical protein